MNARTWVASTLLAALVLGAPLPAAHAGTVYLLNNEEIDGEILDVNVDFVVIKVPGGRQSIPLRDVRDVVFRAGESMWEKKLKDALARAKQQKDEERRKRREEEERRIAEELKRAGVTASAGASAAPIPIPIPVGTTHLAPEVLRLSGIHDCDHFVARFPGNLRVLAPEAGYYTFKDERGAVPWTFNITYFNQRDEGDFDAIRGRAQSELERIPMYSTRTRHPAQVGKVNGERTTGLYERGGRAIRHDQVVVPNSTGVLVIHFFSPGATMDEGAVPEVDAVIKGILVK